MGSKIVYGLLFGIVWLIASIPLRVLYVLSDGIYYILYYLLRYRRAVVRKNLTNSFPDKSKEEILSIEKKFYHYLADYFIEELKLVRMSKEQLKRRMKYFNTEMFLENVEKYGGVILLIPHYAHFEWIIGMGTLLEPGDLPVQIYKPLSNKYFDKLFNYLRSRFGGYNVPKHSTARELLTLRREGKRMAVGLITDQNPSGNDARHWTEFLNQSTVFMDGAERIAKLMRFPVIYCDLKRVKRGYGEVTFRLVTETPRDTGEGEITEAFVRLVEETIVNDPPYWFWSHKRWKHKREE